MSLSTTEKRSGPCLNCFAEISGRGPNADPHPPPRREAHVFLSKSRGNRFAQFASSSPGSGSRSCFGPHHSHNFRTRQMRSSVFTPGDGASVAAPAAPAPPPATRLRARKPLPMLSSPRAAPVGAPPRAWPARGTSRGTPRIRRARERRGCRDEINLYRLEIDYHTQFFIITSHMNINITSHHHAAHSMRLIPGCAAAR